VQLLCPDAQQRTADPFGHAEDGQAEAEGGGVKRWSEYTKDRKPDEKGVYQVVCRFSGMGESYWCPEHSLFRVLAFAMDRGQKGDWWDCPLCSHEHDEAKSRKAIEGEIAKMTRRP
jgi:hypothetical protein